MDRNELPYAVIGAPITIARKVINTAETRCRELIDDAGRPIDDERIAEWADEGKKIISNLTNSDLVDDVAGKMDIDGARTQVSKLRDQLEEMLTNWRNSFEPETSEQSSKAS